MATNYPDNSDAVSVTAFKCRTCGREWFDKDCADYCHANPVCKCGAPTRGKPYILCEACRSEADRAKEAARFDKAKKLTPGEYDGPFFDRHDGFFMDLDDALDHFANDDQEPPPYLWCASPNRMAIDLCQAVERATDDILPTEGQDVEFDYEALKPIQKQVDEWCAAQCGGTGIVSYCTDYSRCVVLSESAALAGPPVGEESHRGT